MTDVSGTRPAASDGDPDAARLLCLAPNPAIDRIIEVDRLLRGTIHRPHLVRAVPGGKGFNVARSAARVGASVRTVALLAGHAGRWIAQELARGGIDGTFVWTEGETRICTSILDAAAQDMTEFYEAGQPVSVAEWDAFEAAVVVETARRPALVTISGSMPPGAPQDGIARTCRALHRAGLKTIVDVGGEALRLALDERPWMVKINEAEASVVSGVITTDEAGTLAACDWLAARTQAGAIVTRGRLGAVAVMSGGAWRITSTAPGGPYTVGSGDAFLAGLAARVAANQAPSHALLFAAALAAANTHQRGAAEFDLADVQAALVTIRVEAIPRS
jgi:1-phosphofructokinase family hexose kinase